MLKQKTSYHFYYALRPNIRGPLTVWPYRIGPRCSSAYALGSVNSFFTSLLFTTHFIRLLVQDTLNFTNLLELSSFLCECTERSFGNISFSPLQH